MAKKTGRPSTYTKEIGDKICDAVVNNKTVIQILTELDIPRTTFFRWLIDNETFRNQYAQAKDKQTELWEDEIIRVAYDGSEDFGFKESKDESGESAKPVYLAEHVNRSRLIVDSLKWLMSKRLPKKYGDKLDIDGKLGGDVRVRWEQ
jgi:hypothetical protein